MTVGDTTDGETPEERRDRWRSVGAVSSVPASRKVDLADGTRVERSYIRNELTGGQAGYVDQHADHRHTTVTPDIKPMTMEAGVPQ